VKFASPSHTPNAFCIVRLLVSLIAVAIAGSHGGGLRIIAQQIEMLGPRQWLGLAAGAFVMSTPMLAPVTQRLAGVFSRRASAPAPDATDLA